MAIIFAEGYDDGVMLGATSGNDLPTVQTAAARTGTRGLRAQTTASGRSSTYTVTIPGTAPATAFVYVAFYTTSLLGQQILLVSDATVNHLSLKLRTDGKFEVLRGFGGTSLATGTFVYTPSTWAQFSIKFTIDDSTGIFQLRLNGSGSEDINFSGDTRNAGTATATRVLVGSIDAGVNTAGVPFYFDDFVIQDTTGSAPNNTWLGDIECKYTWATGAGDNQDWTIGGSSPAATAYQSINEVPVDDGVTLLESSTVNHRCLFAWEDLTNTSATIYAVATNLRALKASAAPREIKSTAKRTSTTLGGLHTLSTSWITYQHIRELDTEGAAWTGTNFNSTQFGCDVVT